MDGLKDATRLVRLRGAPVPDIDGNEAILCGIPRRRERTDTNPATGVASQALQAIAPAGSESDVMTNTDWQDWVGRSESHADVVTTTPVAALAATLDRDDPLPRGGDPLPPLWHWLYFLPLARQSEIGPDGHPKRGGFLPPVPLPRRMWAGSRLSFLQPVRIGEPIERTSTIVDITAKEGRSGPLVFVRVRHAIAGSRGPAIVDEHDIVYREMPAPGERPATPPRAPLHRVVDPGRSDPTTCCCFGIRR
jgi:hydroxyacyl-ACP dehydratase HTD2-like protein with hotdog domain